MAESLAAAVERHGRERPAAPAIAWQGTVLSYESLAAKVRTATAAVDRLAAGPVGLRAAKSPDAVAFVLGVLAAGRSAVLPPADLPGTTLGALFASAGCGAVVTAADLAGLTGGGPAARPPAADAFVLTTSGSTGVPKLVPLTTEAVERFAAWAHETFGLGPGRRVLNYAPLNFDLCLFEIWATLRHGGCVVLADPAIAADGARLAELLAAAEPHVVQAVPLFYQLVTAAAREPLPSVEHAIVTGDALRPARLRELRATFGNARIHNVYGCTETNDSFRYEVRPGDEDRDVLPLGTPLPGVRHDLVETRDDTPPAVVTGPGVGELVVRTPFQSAGYLHPAGAAFGPHPVRDDGHRWFRTGDLVRRDANGELVLAGRADFRVKVRGQQVYLQHVEAVLLASEDVVEAAAVAVPDEDTGKRLHVVVRRRAGSRLNSLVLRRFLAERLPPAALPSTVRISEQPLPRTATGKVDRRLLVTSEEG